MSLSDVKICLGDKPFSSDAGIVNLHLLKVTCWFAYMNEKFFDLYGCAPPQKLYKFIIKRNGQGLFSEYKRQAD